ncbi:unnamed protein product, partial [Acanthocheilonema viteae]
PSKNSSRCNGKDMMNFERDSAALLTTVSAVAVNMAPSNTA